MKPEISVIIPAYNAEQTLKRCLDSVFAQDFDSYEVILVNDGSIDRTLDVAQEYEKHPNFVLIDQPNGGTARARWAGITAGKGDYLAFVDADDYIAPVMMLKMHGKAKDSGAEIVVCGVKKVGAEITLYRQYEELCESGIEATEKIMNGNINGALWNKLFLKNLFLEEDYQRTVGIKYGQDQLLLAPAVARAQKVAYREESLYFYVQNPGSATDRPKVSSLADLVKVRSLLFEFYSSPRFSAWNSLAPYYYAIGLTDVLRILNRVENGSEGKDLREDIHQKLLGIPLSKIAAARRFSVFGDVLLVKTGIFRSVYTAWEEPLLAPLRKFKQKLFVNRSG